MAAWYHGCVTPQMLLHPIPSGEAKVVKVKGSQEAHEAIRPALLTASTPGNAARGETHSDEGNAAVEAGAGQFIHPSDLPLEGLEPQHRALYDLIYRRTLASSMAESEADFTTVSLGAGGIQLSEEGDEVKTVIGTDRFQNGALHGFVPSCYMRDFLLPIV